MRGGYSGFQNSVGTAGAPEQTASRWRTYLMLNYDQRLFGQPVDFGARVTAGQYRAEIDERFVGTERLSQTQAMVRLHWSMDWTPDDRLTVTPSLAGRVTYSVRPSADPRLRLSFRPDGTEQQEFSLAAGLYHQIDGGVTDQRDAGTVFTVWRRPPGEAPLPQALHGIAGYRQRLGSLLEVSVEGYAKRLQNVPVAECPPFPCDSTSSGFRSPSWAGSCSSRDATPRSPPSPRKRAWRPSTASSRSRRARALSA